MFANSDFISLGVTITLGSVGLIRDLSNGLGILQGKFDLSSIIVTRGFYEGAGRLRIPLLSSKLGARGIRLIYMVPLCTR